jgi:hypothetical protein
MTTTRRRIIALTAATLLLLTACGTTTEEPMEPWFIESQKHTIELTEQWKNAIKIRGTGNFTVTHNLPVTKPMLPWLEPAIKNDPNILPGNNQYTLTVSGGGSDMPKGSGIQYLRLGMSAFSPDSAPMECTGNAFVGQVAECGGWVIRVNDANQGDGSFELLSYPKIPGYKLSWTGIGPVEDEVPIVDGGTP